MFAFAGYAGGFYGTDINRVLNEISPYKDGKSYIFEGFLPEKGKYGPDKSFFNGKNTPKLG